MSAQTQPNIPTLAIPIQNGVNKTYIKQGDTIDDIVFTFTNLGFNLTDVGVQINMQLYRGTQRVVNLSVGSGITINSATAFQIDKVLANNYPDGILFGDIQLRWLDGGELQTWTFCNVQYTITKEFTRL